MFARDNALIICIIIYVTCYHNDDYDIIYYNCFHAYEIGVSSGFYYIKYYFVN